jgi:hypothetical protein
VYGEGFKYNDVRGRNLYCCLYYPVYSLSCQSHIYYEGS